MSDPVGIDLGTVNSVIYIYKNNSLNCIKSENGRVLSSFVFYPPANKDVCVGDYAKSQSMKTPQNGIYDSKRFIGRQFQENCVQEICKKYPFQIKPNREGTIQFGIIKDQEEILKTPEEVSSEILKVLKVAAQKYLGHENIEAVITIPAYFNTSQRTATKLAAEKAGITVLKLMSEPSAAALFYFWQTKKTNLLALVFDFGGGTLDISIVRLEGKNMTVVGTYGDAFLGGRNINENLKDYFITDIDDLDKRRLIRLENAVEDIKKSLSTRIDESYTLEMFNKDRSDRELTLTRDKFNELNNNIFNRCIDLLEFCLKRSGIEKTDINEVVLVGGSTRIPKLQEMISKYFDNVVLNNDLDSDEVVAGGAAIQAAIIKGIIPKESAIEQVMEVLPMSIGYGALFDKMEFVLKTNSLLPASGKASFTTTVNNQSQVKVKIFEGNRTNTKLNRSLGELIIPNIPLRPAGLMKYDIEFKVDENGILEIKATNIQGIVQEMRIETNALTKNQTFNALIDENTASLEDENFIKFVNLKSAIYVKLGGYQNTPDKDTINRIKKFLKSTEFSQKQEFKSKMEKILLKLKNESLMRLLTGILEQYES